MSRTFAWLLTLTTGFEGIRAGAGTFRLLLDLPARLQIGPVAFAAFSRATDLSTSGIAFYAVYGIAGFLLTAASWGLALKSKQPRPIIVATGIAALCSALILGLTTQAAPLMWEIGQAADDPVVLGKLIEPFVLWTNLRVVCADVSFIGMLSALAMPAFRQAAGQSPPR